jgi:hypothetical protein
MMLAPAQRSAIEEYLTTVITLFDQTPEQGGCWGQRTMTVVSKLFLTLTGREGGELAGEAKGQAYMAALDDVPCWATEEAARLWYRGECGARHNYTWPPAPAVLREISRQTECSLRRKSTELQHLLLAEGQREFSSEHCASMRSRLGTLAANLATMPKTDHPREHFAVGEECNDQRASA